METNRSIKRTLASIALVVPDYDEAIEYYTRTLRFRLTADTDMGGGKRWVVITPGMPGSSIILAKASTDEQRSRIGNQTGGRVFLFLHTSNFEADYRHLTAHGVAFAEKPRSEVYGTVAVFSDRYGNKWDLIQPK